MHTAGIIPHSVPVPNGNIVLYDLAGHLQYYSSHSSCLETISLHTPSTFLLLSDISKDIDVVKREFNYWCALIGNVSKAQQSSVIVVGTHVDKIKPRELPVKCRCLTEYFENFVQKYNLSFVKFFPLDARAYQSEELKRFMSTLYETTELMTSQGPPISLNSHLLYAFLKELQLNAITLSDLLSHLLQVEEQSLPTSIKDITSLLSILSDRGLITFFSNPNPSDSWIITTPETLLSDIIGALFAPHDFPEYRHIIVSKIGLVPLSSLQKEFKEHNINMIVQFLCHFELCQKVSGTMFASEGTIQPGTCVFFPAFVNAERPSTVTADANSLVWMMRTADMTQFFTVRFLHVLILRLADTFALPDESQRDPALQPFSRRCEVWSTGISWKTESAITTIFQMETSFQCVSLTIDSRKNNRNCPDLLKSVIEVIKRTCEEFCHLFPKNTKEIIICPPEAGGPAEVELPLLRKAVTEKYSETIDITGEKNIDIGIWKAMEPQLSCIIGIEGNRG